MNDCCIRKADGNRLETRNNLFHEESVSGCPLSFDQKTQDIQEYRANEITNLPLPLTLTHIHRP